MLHWAGTGARQGRPNWVRSTVTIIMLQVTVVGIDGRLVYESLVYPEHDIIDFNTRFSGITAKDLGNPFIY